MKKICLTALFAAALLGMSSCRSAKSVTVDSLEGKWKIATVGGEQIPEGMENQPFIEFNVQEKRIHGNAGCNIFNGSYVTEEKAPSHISFPGTITTMMSCPDLELEGRVMQAINDVRSFGQVEQGVALYGEDNTPVLILVKE
jgi:heat shock protein HslJ